MDTSLKAALALIGALIVGGAILGAYQYPKQVQPTLGSAAVGTTFGTQKIAQIVWQPSTDAASSTSLYNSDSNDRIVESVYYSCTGLTTSSTAVAALLFKAATTSTSAPATGIGTNTNLLLGTTVATSTSELYVASTTPGLATSAFVRRWAAGSYLTFNSNALQSAVCNIGVQYMAN